MLHTLGLGGLGHLQECIEGTFLIAIWCVLFNAVLWLEGAETASEFSHLEVGSRHGVVTTLIIGGAFGIDTLVVVRVEALLITGVSHD